MLSSDDGQIDGEYSQMSEMINGRVLRQDHTHTHTNTQQYSLLHLYSHMQIHTHKQLFLPQLRDASPYKMKLGKLSSDKLSRVCLAGV